MNKFSLPSTDGVIPDSNSLIFYCSNPFDTSYLFHFEKKESVVRCVYYELLPDYHQNVNDFAIEQAQLLFFEGYSFELDPKKWTQIKVNAKQLLNLNTGFDRKIACRDCSEYGLAYNSKEKFDNGVNFSSFYKFLLELFLQAYIDKRKE